MPDLADAVKRLTEMADGPSWSFSASATIGDLRTVLAHLERVDRDRKELLEACDEGAGHLSELIEHELSETAALGSVGVHGVMVAAVNTAKRGTP